MFLPLPYEHVALEPHIDACTMQLRHDMYQACYLKYDNRGPDCQDGWRAVADREGAARRFGLARGQVADEMKDEAGLAAATMV